MRWGAVTVLCSPLLTAVACYSEAHFGEFDQAEVISFGIEGEASPSLIFSAERRISVTLPASAEPRRSTIVLLQVSSLAHSSVQVGDEIDLRDDYILRVTAEDGTRADWTIETTQQGAGTGGNGSDGSTDGGAGGLGIEPGDGDGDCASWVLNYEVIGRFEITNTPAAAGDGTFTIGPGQMSFRFVPNDQGGAEISVLSYDMPQSFVVNAPGAVTTNESHAKAGPSECGLASGVLSGSILSWQSCDYGPTPPLGSTSWSPSDVVGGPGCLNSYTVTGQVTCSGAFCAASGVNFPITLNDIYPQPLNAMEFGDGMTSFSMRGLGAPPSGAGKNGVELPNQEPSRTWLGLDGTLIDQSCQPLPSCD